MNLNLLLSNFTLLVLGITSFANAAPKITCIDTSSSTPIADTKNGYSHLSSDGKFILTSGFEDGKMIQTLKNADTGETVLNLTAKGIDSGVFSPDSKNLYIQKNNQLISIPLDKIKASSLDHGKIIAKNIPSNSYINPLENGKFFVTQYNPESGKSNEILIDTKANKQLKLNDGAIKDGFFTEISKDGNYATFNTQNDGIILKNLKTNNTSKLPKNSENTMNGMGYMSLPGSFSSDGKKYYFKKDNHAMYSINLLTGEATEIDLSEINNQNENEERNQWGNWQFFRNSDSVSFTNDTGTTVFNLKTNQKIKIASGNYYSSIPSTDGKRLCISNFNGQTSIIDLNTLEKTEVSNISTCEISKDGKIAINSSGVGYPGGMGMGLMNSAPPTQSIVKFHQTCASEGLRVEMNSKNCLTSTTPAWMDDVIVKTLCKVDFNQENWDKITPPPTGDSISPEEAKKFLLRFQKPGGFNPNQHLSVMFAVLKSDLPKTDPGLVTAALQGVLHTSPNIYENLIKRLPENIVPDKKQENVCRNEKDQKTVQEDTAHYIKSINEKNYYGSDLKAWKSIIPLRNAINSMPEDQRQEFSDKMSDSLVAGAAREYPNIFPSKLSKFSDQVANSYFGLKTKTLSDLTLQRTENMIFPTILGTAPIDGEIETKTKYGFYLKDLNSTKIKASKTSGDQLLKDQVSWLVAGKPYTADIDLKTKEMKIVFDSKAKSPAYDQLWADGKLSGLVVTGSNLHGINTDVMDNYLDYYQSKGFTFSNEATPIPDLKKYMKDQISSGETDYFVKEAHSDGDDMNLFSIDKTATVRIGTRKVGDKTEVIRLVYPDATTPSTELIPNKEFADWVQDREKDKKGQLVYFNTSCWSIKKAANEIEAAQSPLLLDVASTTMVQTFTNSEDSAEQILLTGLRENKSYDELRKNLEKNNEYKNKSMNNFVFPDSKEYIENVEKNTLIPLDINLKITDDRGDVSKLGSH